MNIANHSWKWGTLMFLFLNFGHLLSAQTFPNYEAHLKKGEKKISNDYQHIVSKIRGGWYIERTFYPERNQIISYCTYKSAAMDILHGSYKRWSDHGVLTEEGSYKNGERVGIWKSYSRETEKLVQEGMYKEGVRTGLFKHYYKEGTLLKEVNWEEGERQGAFIYYNRDGTVFNKGVYKDDEILSQEKEGNIYPEGIYDAGNIYTIVDQMPRFPGCEEEDGDNGIKKSCADTKLLKFIYKNIQYPDVARFMQVEGMVVVTFVVDEKGNIIEVETLRGICESLEKECLRIMDMMPIWMPGQHNGEPVRVRYNLPIRFKLN